MQQYCQSLTELIAEIVKYEWHKLQEMHWILEDIRPLKREFKLFPGCKFVKAAEPNEMSDF